MMNTTPRLHSKNNKYFILAAILVLIITAVVVFLTLYYIKDSQKPPAKENAVRIPVLTYHRICSDEAHELITQDRSLFENVSDFETQMNFLNDQGYRTLSTDEFSKWWAGEIKLPKKSVLITFDDGNYSVIKYGLPILRENNMKATIFMMGISTKDKTDTSSYSYDSYYCIGKDVMAQVQQEYPNLEFQSHTWNLHNRIEGKKPVDILSEEELVEDISKQYESFGYTALAYPWGTTSDNMLKALAAEGHTIIAFTYGESAYATRSDDQFKVRRIKVSGTSPIKNFVRWFD